MALDSVSTVGVVGAGQMGSGIAQVAAVHGYDVLLCDVEEAAVASGLDTVDRNLDRLVGDDRLSESEADAARDRLAVTTELSELAESGVVCESVVEDLAVKREVFGDLDGLVAPEAVLATNTSTLSVTSIAAATDRPGRVVGIHFMNPVALIDGVEISPGEHTTKETLALAHEFARDLEKITWEAADRPGFVVNRVLMPWLNEGIRAYDEGVASKADIDRGLKLGTNVPMGPLELADHIGLDVVLDASRTLHTELGERYRPAYLLKRKVEAGDLGKKSGRGFYEYDR